MTSRADADAKNKFIKSLAGSVTGDVRDTNPGSDAIYIHRARTIKRTRDASQQFTLIARGLEGSNFGYASAVAQ